MFYIGLIVGILIMLIVDFIIFVRILRGFLIVDFTIDSETPFSIDISTTVDDIYKSDWVLLRTIRK